VFACEQTNCWGGGGAGGGEVPGQSEQSEGSSGAALVSECGGGAGMGWGCLGGTCSSRHEPANRCDMAERTGWVHPSNGEVLVLVG
jgi:hypothetical protein